MSEAKSTSVEINIHGRDPTTGVVGLAVDHNGSSATLYRRVDGQIIAEQRETRPWVLLCDKAVAHDHMVTTVAHVTELAGDGYRYLVRAQPGNEPAFEYALTDACKRVLKLTTRPRSVRDEALRGHVIAFNAEEQFMLRTGITSFKNLGFEDVVWMALDIEIVQTDANVSFQVTDSPTNRIISMQLLTNKDDRHFISRRAAPAQVKTPEELANDERDILTEFVARVRQIDPDVIVGHNIAGFDLGYIVDHARMQGVHCAIGRDGETLRRWRNGRRLKIGATTQRCPWFTIPGRQLVDTLLVARDFAERDKELKYSGGCGLKSVARHFKVAKPERTYLAGGQIGRLWVAGTEAERDAVERYAMDDVEEVLAIRPFLLGHTFALAQMVPSPFERVVGAGTAAMLERLMLREYLHHRHALPVPTAKTQKFEGGRVELLRQGVFHQVAKCDFESLYPRVMLEFDCLPQSDVLGVLRQLLTLLTDLRLHHKRLMKEAPEGSSERMSHKGRQEAFKILINSAFGMMGTDYMHFNDPEAAARVTAHGRRLIKEVIVELERRGCQVIEVDTDGAFFTLPAEYRDAR